MISRPYRFHGLGSLNYVYRNGKTVRSGGVVLRYAPNNRRKQFRAAVVVSKKINKSAVVRNRIRRRLYEALRPHTSDIEAPYDLVFTVADARIETQPAPELDHIIADLLAKAGVSTPKTGRGTPDSHIIKGKET